MLRNTTHMISTNSLNWKKLDFVENGENYSICMEYPYDVRNDRTGHILKPDYHTGYKRFYLCVNRKVKRYFHHQLVWIAHNGEYDKCLFEIDHVNHIRDDNRIENLRIVSKSQNCRNIGHNRSGSFEYKNELPDVIVVNEEHGIYYCKEYDKFYRRIVNEYRELREKKDPRNNYTYIKWRTQNKQYYFTITNFREQLTK